MIVEIWRWLQGCSLQWMLVLSEHFLFNKSFFKFILLWGGERSAGGRERESQAGSAPSVSLTRGSGSQIARPRPEPKSRVGCPADWATQEPLERFYKSWVLRKLGYGITSDVRNHRFGRTGSTEVGTQHDVLNRRYVWAGGVSGPGWEDGTEGFWLLSFSCSSERKTDKYLQHASECRRRDVGIGSEKAAPTENPNNKSVT